MHSPLLKEGHGLAAVSLKIIEFPDRAVPGEVDADIVWWLGVVDSPLAIVPGLIAAYFYAKYRIDKSGYEETRRRLAEAALTSDVPADDEQILKS